MGVRFSPSMQTILLFLLFIGSLSMIHAIEYKVRVLVPSNGTMSEEMLQWTSAIRLAADQASESWAPHSLAVEIVDYNNDPNIAILSVIEAGQDPSILSIINAGEEKLAESITLLANAFRIPHVIPHLHNTGLNTTGLLFYGLRANITFAPSTVNALLDHYSWSKVGLVYVQDDPDSNIPLLRSQLLSLKNVQFKSIAVSPFAPTFYDIAETIIRHNLNVVVKNFVQIP